MIRLLADGCSTILAIFAVGLFFGLGFWTAQMLLTMLAMNINNRLARRRVAALNKKIETPAQPQPAQPEANEVKWVTSRDLHFN